MRNFETTCLFPCLCETCKKLVQVNIMIQPLECPKCKDSAVIPYDDPRLLGSTGPLQPSITWGDHILTNGDYLCPKCKKMSLRFKEGTILWD